MKINGVIQAKRKELNMTQMQLAEKLDVSDKTVSRWELGTVYPNIDMIPRIAAVLKINVGELFGDNANLDERINTTETRDYRKMTILKINLYLLIGSSAISMILFFSGIKLSENSSKGSAALIISSFVLFFCFTIAFFIARMLFSSFYKGKFYINEYKLLDGKVTATAIYICSLMFCIYCIGKVALCMLTFSAASFMVYGFLRQLGYLLGKKCLAMGIVTLVLYIIFLLISAISLFSHQVFLVVPLIVFLFVIHFFACRTFLACIKND